MFHSSCQNESEILKLTTKVFTVKQNNSSKLKYERKLYCKERDCPAQARVITFHDICYTYLWLSRIIHLPSCTYKDKFGIQHKEELVFQDPVFHALVCSTLPPKNVISTYNNERQKRNLSPLKESTELTRKISQIRHKYTKKDQEEAGANLIVNVDELKKEAQRTSFNDEQIGQLSRNTCFVAGSYFDGDNFAVVLTSKMLLENSFNQGNCYPRLLAVDGTYKLNNVKFPTLVIGTTDINRKFHLGTMLFFFSLILYSRIMCNEFRMCKILFMFAQFNSKKLENYLS